MGGHRPCAVSARPSAGGRRPPSHLLRCARELQGVGDDLVAGPDRSAQHHLRAIGQRRAGFDLNPAKAAASLETEYPVFVVEPQQRRNRDHDPVVEALGREAGRGKHPRRFRRFAEFWRT